MMPKRTATRMRSLVARWRRSGESQAGFTCRRGIPTWTFWYWCRKLSEPDAVAPEGVSGVRARPRDTGGGGRGHRGRLPGRRAGAHHAGASADLVRRVVAALRAC